MKEETKEAILGMSQEFDDKETFVTCEISIHKDKLDAFEAFVKEFTNIKLGKWIVTECDTCVGYHGEGYLHASIERFDIISQIEASSNFVRTIK